VVGNYESGYAYTISVIKPPTGNWIEYWIIVYLFSFHSWCWIFSNKKTDQSYSYGLIYIWDLGI
jgi:hypothetical protein